MRCVFLCWVVVMINHSYQLRNREFLQCDMRAACCVLNNTLRNCARVTPVVSSDVWAAAAAAVFTPSSANIRVILHREHRNQQKEKHIVCVLWGGVAGED